MLTPITIRYPVRPVRRSLITGQVADLFGLDEAEPPQVIAEGLTLDVRPGDVVLFTGPSGSGKSSILKAVGEQLGAIDAARLELPDGPLVEALPGPLADRLAVLAGCGLSEARVLLRSPGELSDGQRYRFRIAYALSFVSRPLSVALSPEPAGLKQRTTDNGQRTILLDEFAAVLERPLAKVLAYNLRKLATRTGVGVLCATTHEDVADDLGPDLWVRCGSGGRVEAERRGVKKKAVSFANELWLSAGSRSDWPYFAGWHYRGRRLAVVRRVVVLWHRAEPVGICVFGAPAAALSLRSRYFGLVGPSGRAALAALNAKVWLLQRVVLHPGYRGAGIAAAFVRRACELCPADWVETLSAMGHANPLFERAGFVRVGVVRDKSLDHGAYGGRSRAAGTDRKSRFSEPVYYVFDNRRCLRGPVTP